MGDPHSTIASFNTVSPGFFAALGIPLLAGRDFAWSDSSRASGVAIVSRHLARALFGDGTPLHERIRLNADPRFQNLDVIGVIGDARAADLKDPNLNAMYIPSLQIGAVADSKAIITRGTATASEINNAIERLGREIVRESSSLEQLIDRALVRERITASSKVSVEIDRHFGVIED